LRLLAAGTASTAAPKFGLVATRLKTLASVSVAIVFMIPLTLKRPERSAAPPTTGSGRKSGLTVSVPEVAMPAGGVNYNMLELDAAARIALVAPAHVGASLRSRRWRGVAADVHGLEGEGRPAH